MDSDLNSNTKYLKLYLQMSLQTENAKTVYTLFFIKA